MRPGSTVLWRCAVVVSAIAISSIGVLGEILVRPIVNYELGWLVIDAGVTAAIAGAAIAAAFLASSRAPTVLMLTAALTLTFSNLALGIQAASAWWILFASLSGAVHVVLVVLAATYPSGRMRPRSGRIVVACALAVFVATVVSRVLLYDPGRWKWCDCVPNPFALVPAESLHLFSESMIGLARAAVSLVVLAFVVARSWREPPDWRRIDLPVLVGAALTAVAWIVTDLQQSVGIGWTGDGPVYLRSSAAALIPAAVIAGLLVMRSLRARVADLALATAGRDPRRIESMLAASIGDPTLRVLWWDRRAAVYRDGAGASADPHPVAGEAAHEISSSRGPVALVLRSGTSHDRGDLRAVADALTVSAENAVLSDELERTLDEVRESRARLVSAGDEARRRIERDLHDGAQQLMVSSAINLKLARDEAIGYDDPSLSEAIDRASAQLALALAELRELARGITPTVLALGGIGSALEELALRSPVPVTVTVPSELRLPDLEGATVYFVVAECLTNIARHSAATQATVRLETGAALTVSVDDDGLGGARVDAGSGLRGVADRIEATGGSFRISSPPGGGTHVVATIPSAGRAGSP